MNKQKKQLNWPRLMITTILSSTLVGCVSTTADEEIVVDAATGKVALVGQGCKTLTEPVAADAYFNNLLKSAPDFANPPVVDFSADKNNRAVMELEYQNFNIAGCSTFLRSYNGPWSDGRAIGPTMRINPGDVYNALIVNNLSDIEAFADGKAYMIGAIKGIKKKLKTTLRKHGEKFHHEKFTGHGGHSTRSGYVPPEHVMSEPNVPHDFNVTNLHTHGWHVNPADNSDNVLVSIPPIDLDDPSNLNHIYGQTIYLPRDHVAGTFWYHPHKHGSTTIQVGSGMAGALQVVDYEKGLDSIPQIRQAKDNILVMQQVAYGEDGLIEDYTNLQEKPFGALNRPTLVNGQVYPKIQVKVDEVQRWRFVHAGITAPIAPQIIKKTAECDSSATAAFNFIELALDGIPVGAVNGEPITKNTATLYPGYRYDALVQFDATTAKVGDEFLLVDTKRACSNTDSVTGNDYRNPRYVLAQIEVVAGEAQATALPDGAQLAKARAVYEVEGGPIEPISDAELANSGDRQDGSHFSAYSLVRSTKLNNLPYLCPFDGGYCSPCNDEGKTSDGRTCANQTDFKNATEKAPDDTWYIKDGDKVATGNYMVCGVNNLASKAPDVETGQDGKCMTFNAKQEYVNSLKLGSASEWTVSGKSGANSTHVFHIHVNPFQIKRKYLNEPNEQNPEQWVWKDTMFAPNPNSDYKPAKFRSRYTVFTGAFVQHCHVLNHEDQGMMQIVEVVRE